MNISNNLNHSFHLKGEQFINSKNKANDQKSKYKLNQFSRQFKNRDEGKINKNNQLFFNKKVERREPNYYIVYKIAPNFSRIQVSYEINYRPNSGVLV